MASGLVHEATVGKSAEWYTPPAIFKALALTFDLDPCAPPGGLPWVPAARFISPPQDGLGEPWSGRVWLNPPYTGHLGRWLGKLGQHGDGVALVFARLDTNWAQGAIMAADAVCFIRQRVRFLDRLGRERGTPGAPSMLLGYGDVCGRAVYDCGLGVVVAP